MFDLEVFNLLHTLFFLLFRLILLLCALQWRAVQEKCKHHLPLPALLPVCPGHARSWSATVSSFLFSPIRRKEWLTCQTHLHSCHVLGSYPASTLNSTQTWQRLHLEIKVLLILSCLDLHRLSRYTTLSISSLMNSLHPESITVPPRQHSHVWCGL